ncbi:DNA adenine methylase [Tessaracoccus sp.]
MTAQPVAAPTPEPALRAPFPYFGGKTKVASLVWERIGNPSNFVEPFAGSAAVLLARPNDHQWWDQYETINDRDGMVANFFRAIKADPDAVAEHANWNVNEADLTARHLWLVQNRENLTGQLMADPDWFDARAAGWWVWGISAWIGGEWCSGIGPYTGTDQPSLTHGGTAPGVYRKMPMNSGAHGGKGIHRPRPVLGLVGSLTGPEGPDVPDITGSVRDTLTGDFTALTNRLRRVRVACGDWTRVLRNAAQPAAGHITGVFLDPPYSPELRRGDLYAVGDRPEDRDNAVHNQARAWALEHGALTNYRVAYATYSEPVENQLFINANWTPVHWTASGGYGLHGDNRALANRDLELIWFSPACLDPTESGPDTDQQLSLFEEIT